MQNNGTNTLLSFVKLFNAIEYWVVACLHDVIDYIKTMGTTKWDTPQGFMRELPIGIHLTGL
jgi:hypothetical protein